MNDKSEFIRIDKDYLLAEDRVIDFDIYVYREGRSAGELVLLCAKDSNISNIRDVLARKYLGRLYVRRRDYDRFKRFLESSIDDVIHDVHAPLQKKSEIVYNCASNVVKDVFEDPRSGENLSRTRGITRNLISFVLKDNASIPTLLQLGSHDYYTFSHCVHVAVFAVGLAQMISSRPEHELLELAMGSILHDVGKTRVDPAIINKPGKLTAEEFEAVKMHPTYGYDMMKDAVSANSADIVLHHHEKYNGRGYPEGLSGNAISDNARIAAIADVYDALTTNRCYANARKPFEAVMLMKEEMVGHFAEDEFKRFILFLGGRKKGMGG